MNIEHTAYSVTDPVAMAKWYVDNMGMRVVRNIGAPTYTHFLADEGGRVMIEIYNNPKVTPPDYFRLDPLIVHLAFSTEDVCGMCTKLEAAGAAVVDKPFRIEETGDELAMLRDPWGFAIQLVKRAQQMLEA